MVQLLPGFDDDNLDVAGTGDPFGSPDADDSMFGVTSVHQVILRGGLYGAGRFGYSIPVRISTALAGTAATTGSASVNFDSSASLQL